MGRWVGDGPRYWEVGRSHIYELCSLIGIYCHVFRLEGDVQQQSNGENDGSSYRHDVYLTL